MVLEYESQHLPHKSPSFVGKYTIHGAPYLFSVLPTSDVLDFQRRIGSRIWDHGLQGRIGTIQSD